HVDAGRLKQLGIERIELELAVLDLHQEVTVGEQHLGSVPPGSGLSPDRRVHFRSRTYVLYSARMATWSEFAAAAPRMARDVKTLIHQYGPGFGYLATVRAD